MAKIRAEQPLVPSVLDRLLDDDPGVKREPGMSRHQVLRELKQSVRRDLENLLNTRRRCGDWPDDLTELGRSLVSYGIPDFTGAGVSTTAQREDFRALLESILRTCEPRFKTVQVQLLDNTESL